MAPLQIITLLILVRLPALLSSPPPAATSPASSHSSFVICHSSFVLLSFLASHLLLILYVFLAAKSAIRKLHLTTTSTVSITSRFDQLLAFARWATILFTAVHLYLPHSLGLPHLVQPFLASTRILKHIPLLEEALYIAPALLAWIAFWTAAYFVDSACRQRSLPYRLASQLPVHEMPSLPAYLSMHLRHNFYLLLPIALLSLIDILADHAPPWLPNASAFSTAASLLVLLLMMPWLITRIWATTPLTGPLRHHLDALAAKYHLRFKNILVWKTHNAITNAAILGYLPFSRYFLMTDALLETLSDQQLEAVFAHEVGHGVHHHLWWYLTGFAASFLMATAAAALLAPHLPASLLLLVGDTPPSSDHAALLLSLLFLAPCAALGFPLISHQFEHQADFFAAQHMNINPNPNPYLYPYLNPPDPQTLTPDPSDLSPSAPSASSANSAVESTSQGAEIFISSLDAIVELAHRSRDRRGWMHPSINHRIRLLRTLAASPLAQKAFARRQLRTRLSLLLFLLAALALTTFTTLHPSPPTPNPNPNLVPASPQNQAQGLQGFAPISGGTLECLAFQGRMPPKDNSSNRQVAVYSRAFLEGQRPGTLCT